MWKLIKILSILLGLYIVFWITTDSWGKRIKQQPTVKKLLDIFFDAFLIIFSVVMYSLAIAAIPGLIILIIELIEAFAVFLHKFAASIMHFTTKLGWWLYVIDVALGIGISIYMFKRRAK